MNTYKITIVDHEIVYAIANNLYEGFNSWKIMSMRGWSVAHEATKTTVLPLDFELWALGNREGWLVAHEAARNNTLPSGFNQWGLMGRVGLSVAHVAATSGSGYLPADFDQWELTNKRGLSVKDVHEKYQKELAQREEGYESIPF